MIPTPWRLLLLLLISVTVWQNAIGSDNGKMKIKTRFRKLDFDENSIKIDFVPKNPISHNKVKAYCFWWKKVVILFCKRKYRLFEQTHCNWHAMKNLCLACKLIFNINFILPCHDFACKSKFTWQSIGL